MNVQHPIDQSLLDQLPRKPWVGDRYTGLLILGEREYQWSTETPRTPEQDTQATYERVEQVINGRRLGFFTRLAIAVSGLPAERVNHAEFWPTVAFANFAPALLSQPREQPTPDQFRGNYSPPR